MSLLLLLRAPRTGAVSAVATSAASIAAGSAGTPSMSGGRP
jgi:hypothetical protein